MNRRFPQEELLNLASQLLDGQLDDAKYDRLCELVADDQAAATWLVDWMEQHVMLEVDLGSLDRGTLAARPLLGQVGCGPESACHTEASTHTDGANSASMKPQSAAWGSRHALTALAACLLLVLGFRIGWYAGSEAHQLPNLPIEAAESAPLRPAPYTAEVATIVGGVDAQFADGASLGMRLTPGRLSLRSGMVQIAFDRGATVVLQGPAELEIFHDGSCNLLSGALSADVSPDASGFMVAAGGLAVAEGDAQFGVITAPDTFTEVHALGGEVSLVDFRHPSDEQRRLTEGEALRWRAGQGVEGISPNPTAFVSNDKFRETQLLLEQQSYDRWLTYSRRWLEDPSVVLRYEFSQAIGDSIPNAANIGAHEAISHQSARMVRGRWSLKPAMLFDGRTDVLLVPDQPELHLTGDLTVAVWLRTRSYPLHGWTRVIGKGAGCDRNYGLWMYHTGELLWQICADTAPQSQADWDRYSLRTSPIPIGKWVLVTGIVDDGQMKVYVNGSLRAEAKAPPKYALSNVPLMVGYYGNAPGHNQYFCGDIDEIILLDRAMTEQELLEFYEAGDPANTGDTVPEGAKSPGGESQWGVQQRGV